MTHEILQSIAEIKQTNMRKFTEKSSKNLRSQLSLRNNSQSKSLTTSQLSQHKKTRPKWKKQIDKFLDSPLVLIVMSIFTIFALFSSDIQVAWLRKEVDEPFNIVQCILLFFFFAEFILNCISKPEYPLSFFFWLDLIATISLIQDIDYVMDPLMGYGPITGASNKKSIQAAKAVAKVSSASRATRVLRVIRIVRLIRMVKLYKNVYIARENIEKSKEEMKQQELKRKKEETELSSLNTSKIPTDNKKSDYSSTQSNGLFHEGDEVKLTTHNTLLLNPFSPKTNETTQQTTDVGKQCLLRKKIIDHKSKDEADEDQELVKESKISRIISESITKKVIILILSLLIIFPLLSEDFYSDDSTIVYTFLAHVLSIDFNVHGEIKTISDIAIGNLIDAQFPIVNITKNGTLIYDNTDYDKQYFRYKEVRHVYSNDALIEITYSIFKETSMTGWLNVIQTFFICFCLVFAALSFEKQVNTLVLQPLEIMIEIADIVAKDPMNAKNVENLQTGVKALIAKENKCENLYEIMIIKSAIIKISALLAIGFGEAGGEIITKNLTSSSELNTRIKGKTKSAIFGFCDIRQFEDITLALEERIMLFVNEIAEVVHSSVDLFGGSTNKNIGEAFLNIWKFYNETPIKTYGIERTKKVQRKDNLFDIDPSNKQVAITADSAIFACLKILIKINKRCNILSYRENPNILKKIKDFQLNMGFGLHMGYGIEGAVGSSYKIDASYLSPNVNIAARLESATRQFGVPLLLSGVLYEKCSLEMKGLCRFVDRVKVKGSQLPLDLYTIDTNLNLTHQDCKNIIIMANKDKRQYYADKKDIFKRKIDLIGSVSQIILEKPSYLELLKTQKTREFYTLWDEGIVEYQKGNFSIANSKFQQCFSLDPSDGPTQTLMSFLQKTNYKAPKEWGGTRELLSK